MNRIIIARELLCAARSLLASYVRVKGEGDGVEFDDWAKWVEKEFGIKVDTSYAQTGSAIWLYTAKCRGETIGYLEVKGRIDSFLGQEVFFHTNLELSGESLVTSGKPPSAQQMIDFTKQRIQQKPSRLLQTLKGSGLTGAEKEKLLVPQIEAVRRDMKQVLDGYEREVARALPEAKISFVHNESKRPMWDEYSYDRHQVLLRSFVDSVRGNIISFVFGYDVDDKMKVRTSPTTEVSVMEVTTQVNGYPSAAWVIGKLKGLDKKELGVGGPDMRAVADFLKASRTWFEFDETTMEKIVMSTRENGEVGNETPGREDIREAKRLVQEVKRKFGDSLKAYVETADEWVYLNIYPNV